MIKTRLWLQHEIPGMIHWMWRPPDTYIWPDLRATYFLLLEQHRISVFLRLSVSIKDKWIPKTLHDNKKYDSSPSYSDKIEYDADGNGSNMAYSSKVAVEYKHHKVFVYVSRFYAPAIPSRVSLKMKVVVMVWYAAACLKKNHSMIKLWGINNISSSWPLVVFPPLFILLI